MKFTHCELHPSLILGTQGCTIQVVQHNPVLVILIRVLKENKRLVVMLLTLIIVLMMKKEMYCIILKNQLYLLEFLNI